MGAIAFLYFTRMNMGERGCQEVGTAICAPVRHPSSGNCKNQAHKAIGQQTPSQ